MTRQMTAVLAALACGLLAASTAAAATATFTGVIRSNQCVGPACATMCPSDKDPVYTLQTTDRAWVLSDPKLASQLAAKFAGQKLTVRGSTRGNKLRISSVTPAN